jgi:outer membrane protein
MLKYFLLFASTIIAPYLLSAQGQVLETYIQQALTTSDALKQQGFLLQKNVEALEEAKGLFRPTVTSSMTYTLGVGGRKIDFPIGDLLNPAYATLNKLTQSTNFPTLKNQTIRFAPNNFYDAKIRTVYPIVNYEIKINEKVKKEFITLQENDISIYKRELTKEVKVAYFKYLQTVQAIQAFDNGLKLLAEVKRVNQSLVNNGVALSANLLRSNADIAKVETQRLEMQNNQHNAAAYLNFLLNQALKTPIKIDSSFWSKTLVFSTALTTNTQSREELQKLQTAARLTNLQLEAAQSYYKPKVGTFLDLGIQGYIANIAQTPYAFGGVQLDYPLWDGHRNQHKIEQARADVAALQAQTEGVGEQLELQAQVALNSYLTSIEVRENGKAQIDFMQRIYNDTFKRYKEGQALYIELSDAQTQLLNAQLQQSIALSNVWIRLAELDRVK